MFKVKQLTVAAAIALFAGAAMASNFRAADQVYVPAAGHISSASATFISDVFISNLSDQSVDVSVIFSTGSSGAQTPFPKVLTLAPRERRELLANGIDVKLGGRIHLDSVACCAVALFNK